MMTSSTNKGDIDQLVFHWDEQADSNLNKFESDEKPSIMEYIEFLEEFNKSTSFKKEKSAIYPEAFVLL